MKDFNLMSTPRAMAITGGALVMLLVAPKVMLFLAGMAAVIWGFSEIKGT